MNKELNKNINDFNTSLFSHSPEAFQENPKIPSNFSVHNNRKEANKSVNIVREPKIGLEGQNLNNMSSIQNSPRK